MKQPLYETITLELEKVLRGELSREQVVDWAMQFIEYDDLEIDDFVAWEFLKNVGGLDVIEAPNEYLYSNKDIEEWISDYKGKCK